ncbi:MAG: AI-2E family transporter [Actinomycetota bacterium]|nr:AI-2E family transporter [Actinomycetota bacterium]
MTGSEARDSGNRAGSVTAVEPADDALLDQVRSPEPAEPHGSGSGPAAGAHSEPEAEVPSGPEAEVPSGPEAEVPSRPADDAHSEPEVEPEVEPEPVPLLVAPVVADRPAMPMTTLTAEAVIWPVRVASEWAARLLIIALGCYVLLLALSKVSLVAFALVVALFFVAVLHPVESRVRVAFGGRKSLSTAVVLLGGILVFGLITWFVVAQISSHSGALAQQVSAVGDKVREWLKNGPLKLKDQEVSNAITNLTNTIRDHQGQLVSRALNTVSILLELVGGLLLALVSTFFLLRDGDQIWHWVLRLMPRSARARVDYAGERGWNTLGGYIRGQVSIAVIHAVTISIALVVLRVPLAAALGVVILLGSFVPLLGLTIAGALCVGVTLLEHGVTAAIIILIIIVALVQLEGNVLQPLIMSRAVHIHPLAVAVSVTAGTIIYGIIGALIAVPLVAFTNSFIRGLRNELDDPVTEGHLPGDVTPPT